MTTISGAGEESAITAWGKTMIAQSQKANAERAAAKAAAEAANPDSTVVTLSDGAKAMKAANDWRISSIHAIKEKANIELAQWDHAVRTAGTDDPNTLYAKFADAGEAEKEAYVQRKLIDFDMRREMNAVSRKFSELLNYPISEGPSDAEIASRREDTERNARRDVLLYSKGPIVHNPSARHRTDTPSNVQQNEQGAAPVARVKNTVESIAAAQRASLDQMRQAMGAGTGVATDPAVQKSALPSAPGQPSVAEQLAVAQQRIDKVQSEFGALAEIWQKAAERGEKWALPHVPDPSADNTGVNTFRYEENHQMYLTNIAYLPLEMARKSLEFGEHIAHSNMLDNRHLNSHYGDQAISDINTYIAAMKDHISKLENGGSPLIFQPTKK